MLHGESSHAHTGLVKTFSDKYTLCALGRYSGNHCSRALGPTPDKTTKGASSRKIKHCYSLLFSRSTPSSGRPWGISPWTWMPHAPTT